MKQNESSNKIIEFRPRGLVRVIENTGIEETHIALPPELKEKFLELASRWPEIGWMKQPAKKPSHRYPDKEEDKKAAYQRAELLRQLVSHIEDPAGIAQDFLFTAMGISLLGGHLLDSHVLILKDMLDGKIIEMEKGKEVIDWLDEDLQAEEKIIQFVKRITVLKPETGKISTEVSYPSDLGSAFWLLQHFTKTPLTGTHPIPEDSAEQREDYILGYLFKKLMGSLVYLDARNFALASAGRLAALGHISTKNLLKIEEASRKTTYEQRNARMYPDPEELDEWESILHKILAHRMKRAEESAARKTADEKLQIHSPIKTDVFQELESPEKEKASRAQVSKDVIRRRGKGKRDFYRSREAQAEFEATAPTQEQIEAFLEEFQQPVLQLIDDLKVAGYIVEDCEKDFLYRGDLGETDENYRKTCELSKVRGSSRGLTDYRVDEAWAFGFSWEIKAWTEETLGIMRMFPKATETAHLAAVEFETHEYSREITTLQELPMIKKELEVVIKSWIEKYDDRQRRYFRK